jgi:4-aminobutyrate aminotransferase-like enzyme
VLDVIRDEELQQNAQEVGQYLLDGLRQLQQEHPLIGDVRGLGLFLGIEFVRDRETLEPADAPAARIVERMKERGVLLSTDGPFHNVIKIKPPLVFSERDADFLLSNLKDVLED